MANVPIGDDVFVNAVLRTKTRNAMSKIDTMINQLRIPHTQSQFCVLQYALSPLIDYWIQHCYPADVQPFAQMMDDRLRQVACNTFAGINVEDPITLSRLQMPAQMYGGAIRSRVELKPAAFVATLCRTLPMMLDARDENGVVAIGFSLRPLSAK